MQALQECRSKKLVPNPGQVDLWTNFEDYGLRSPVGLLRADAHTMPFRCRRNCSPNTKLTSSPMSSAVAGTCCTRT